MRFQLQNVNFEITTLKIEKSYDVEYTLALYSFLIKKIKEYHALFGILPNSNVTFYFHYHNYRNSIFQPIHDIHYPILDEKPSSKGIAFCISEQAIFDEKIVLFIAEKLV